MSDTALAVGEQIYTYQQMDELPVGSVICENGNEGRAWEKQRDGMWHGIRGITGVHGADAFSMEGYNRVWARPGVPPPEPPQETLLQFMWKFRENALSGAHENGVSLEATMKGLRLLGLDIPWELGPGVQMKTLDDRLDLPDGVVVVNASLTDPKHEDYTLFVRKGRRWTIILGRAGLGRDAVIVDYPGVTETPAWWAQQGDEDAARQVAQFKARAWRVGQQIKSEQSWCNTYEHVIARVGVTARSIREAQVGAGFGPGDRIGQRDAVSLPAGSLLIYRSNDWTDHWAVYERDDSCDNMTRTRRIAGHRDERAASLGHYQSVMTVLAMPIEAGQPAQADPPQVPQILDLLPIGTVFTYSGCQYVICRDRQIITWTRATEEIPARGIHQASAFTGAHIIINIYPGDNS